MDKVSRADLPLEEARASVFISISLFNTSEASTNSSFSLPASDDDGLTFRFKRSADACALLSFAYSVIPSAKTGSDSGVPCRETEISASVIGVLAAIVSLSSWNAWF